MHPPKKSAMLLLHKPRRWHSDKKWSNRNERGRQEEGRWGRRQAQNPRNHSNPKRGTLSEATAAAAWFQVAEKTMTRGGHYSTELLSSETGGNSDSGIVQYGAWNIHIYRDRYIYSCESGIFSFLLDWNWQLHTIVEYFHGAELDSEYGTCKMTLHSVWNLQSSLSTGLELTNTPAWNVFLEWDWWI